MKKKNEKKERKYILKVLNNKLVMILRISNFSVPRG